MSILKEETVREYASFSVIRLVGEERPHQCFGCNHSQWFRSSYNGCEYIRCRTKENHNYGYAYTWYEMMTGGLNSLNPNEDCQWVGKKSFWRKLRDILPTRWD